MANSICLSTDMNELYLIDATGTTTFVGSLAGNGVLVSLDVSGNLSASIATSAPRGGATFQKPITGAQWNFGYHESNKNLYVIGVVDVDNTRSDAQGFPLGEEQEVNIYINSNDLCIK